MLLRRLRRHWDILIYPRQTRARNWGRGVRLLVHRRRKRAPLLWRILLRSLGLPPLRWQGRQYLLPFPRRPRVRTSQHHRLSYQWLEATDLRLAVTRTTRAWRVSGQRASGRRARGSLSDRTGCQGGLKSRLERGTIACSFTCGIVCTYAFALEGYGIRAWMGRRREDYYSVNVVIFVSSTPSRSAS